MEVGVVEKK